MLILRIPGGFRMADFDTSRYTNDGSPPTGGWAIERDGRHPKTDAVLDRSAEIAIEVWRSFEHSVKQPVLAVAEIADHASGSSLSQATWLNTPAPPEAEFNSAKYWAQQTGATLGSLPWFSALHKAVGTGMRSVVGPGVFEALTTSQLHQYAIAESMITGFTYGAVLRPSRCTDNKCLPNFAKERLLTGATTAATFGVGALASARITDAIGLNPTMGQKIATSFAASAFAGGFDAEIQALRKHGRLANEKEFARGMYTYAVVGAGMTTIHEVFPSTKSETLKQRDSSYHPDEKVARLALSGLPEAVRLAAFRSQSEAVIMRSPTGIDSPAGLARPNAERMPQPAQPEPLWGAPRVVYDRLQQAGLRPSIFETSSGPEIRIPLGRLQTGPNGLLRSAIKAIDKGIEDRWQQNDLDAIGKPPSDTPAKK